MRGGSANSYPDLRAEWDKIAGATSVPDVLGTASARTCCALVGAARRSLPGSPSSRADRERHAPTWKECTYSPCETSARTACNIDIWCPTGATHVGGRTSFRFRACTVQYTHAAFPPSCSLAVRVGPGMDHKYDHPAMTYVLTFFPRICTPEQTVCPSPHSRAFSPTLVGSPPRRKDVPYPAHW